MKTTILLTLFLFVSCVLVVESLLGLGYKQSAGVRGVLMCNERPAGNVAVRLYDYDDGPVPNDLMASGTTDRNGSFFLRGYTTEITKIDPKLEIYHDCEDGNMPCQKRIAIWIPKRYITPGKKATRIFDAGTIQLAGAREGQGRMCGNWLRLNPSTGGHGD